MEYSPTINQRVKCGDGNGPLQSEGSYDMMSSPVQDFICTSTFQLRVTALSQQTQTQGEVKPDRTRWSDKATRLQNVFMCWQQQVETG